MLEHALDHDVIAVDVAADEGRRVGEGDVERPAGTESLSLAVWMNECRSSPMTSAMQVVETAIIFGP